MTKNHEDVASFTRKRAEPNTFPDHLPRERVVIAPPPTCECCGGNAAAQAGRGCDPDTGGDPAAMEGDRNGTRKSSAAGIARRSAQTPAPFHVIARGWAGPSLLGDDPVREVRPASAVEPAGRALCTRRRADQPVDDGRRRRDRAVRRAFDPVLRRVEAHVMAAERLHGDDIDQRPSASQRAKTDTGQVLLVWTTP